MDQDFHYYGTYYAAKKGGFSKDDATLIAKAANFIDFFTNESYAAYWKLVSDTKKTSHYTILGNLDFPRYTFQGTMSVGFAPEDGLWCSYHFAPGNYADPANTYSRESVHGNEVARYLPQFQTRDTNGGKKILENPLYYGITTLKYRKDLQYGHLLNRPQSALSRHIIMDAIQCATNPSRLESILSYAKGGEYLLQHNKEENLRRFKLILLGVRAHVIADTWAHQDFCGLNNVLNTYWDVSYTGGLSSPIEIHINRHSFLNVKYTGDWGLEQFIEYDDGTTNGWKKQMLSKIKAGIGLLSENLEAVPNGISYTGHGWMGHLPDFSFAKFQYKPCWADPKNVTVRDNPQQYEYAWVELASLFTQAKGAGHLKLDASFQNDLNKAISAIKTPCKLEAKVTGRKASANAWQKAFGDLPSTMIDVDKEPDSPAVLDGMVEKTNHFDRYGTHYVTINSDLYLFQIAADYHFWFVKSYLEQQNLYRYKGSWSQQISALSPKVLTLFDEHHSKNAYLSHMAFQTGTALHETDDTVTFALASNNDLFVIKKSHTGTHTTEVHVLSSGSHYQTFSLHTGTALHETDDTFEFLLAQNKDLFVIKKSNTGSHTTEVHVLSASSNYQQFSLQTATALHETDASSSFVLAPNNDLFVIQKNNTGTHSTEIHVLSASSNYQQFVLQTGTALHETDITFEFAIAQNRDLFAIKKSGTESCSTEVHVLSASSNYQQFSLQTGTALHETDNAFAFGITHARELFAIKKRNTGTHSTEIHIATL